MDSNINTPEFEEIRVSDVDPFPVPGDYPCGWDMEAILQPSPAKKRGSQPLPEWHEAFHDDRTFPKGWNF